MPRNFYKIYIPVKGAPVSVGSLYWKSAQFRFKRSFIETIYLESGPTPRVAALKYIYRQPSSGRIPGRVYAENIKDNSDNGTFSSEELEKEITKKIKLGGLPLLKEDW